MDSGRGSCAHISIVCFSKKKAEFAELDGDRVLHIFSDLTASSSGLDLTKARKLKQNKDTAFIGTMKNGPFNITYEQALEWLSLPLNPNNRPNSDVLRPWVNGIDITRRLSNQWIIDFDPDANPGTLALYEAPLDYILKNVKPLRDPLRRKAYRELWWKFQDHKTRIRRKISTISRYIITPRVSKHRLFAWLNKNVVPDSACVAVCRDDDVCFGILHSKFHEIWTLRLCTYLGVGNDPRYTQQHIRNISFSGRANARPSSVLLH